MKVRIKFSKLGNIKYIGHLDLLRLIQRSIRRAQLPIVYSQGYNPHQLLSIALPLPLGATSEGEYMDLVFADESIPEENEIKEKLNYYLPEGIMIKNVFILGEDMRIGMAAVDAAQYQTFIHKNTLSDFLLEKVTDFFAQKEISVNKVNKKGTMEIDVKDMVYQYTVSQNEEQWIISLLLAAGSRRNLKPEMIIKQLYENNGWDYKDYKIQIHRKDIFSIIDNKFISLSSFHKWSE